MNYFQIVYAAIIVVLNFCLMAAFPWSLLFWLDGDVRVDLKRVSAIASIEARPSVHQSLA